MELFSLEPVCLNIIGEEGSRLIFIIPRLGVRGDSDKKNSGEGAGVGLVRKGHV